MCKTDLWGRAMYGAAVCDTLSCCQNENTGIKLDFHLHPAVTLGFLVIADDSAVAQDLSMAGNNISNTYLVVQVEGAWEVGLLEVDLEEGLGVGRGVGLGDVLEGDQGATCEASAPSVLQVESGV